MTGERLSRARRELVFARSGGVCQRLECDNAITLETFHAAHLRARANGGVLDDSNLQAWCSRCNLTLGARDAADPRLTPREWQLSALDQVTARIMQSGAATVSAAPGAGRTVFAALVFEHLRDAGFVDRMVVFVPNRHLVEQWASALYKSRHIELKPNSAIERPGQAGVVVTYQSLNNRESLEVHMSQASRRTLLVLDEVHHVAQGLGGELPAWARNIGELAGDIASHQLNVAGVLNLSGTLWRSAPGERISTVRYRQVDDARLESMVDFEVTVGELVSPRRATANRPLPTRRSSPARRLSES